MRSFRIAVLALAVGLACTAHADEYPDKDKLPKGPTVVTLPGVSPAVVAPADGAAKKPGKAADAAGHVVIDVTPGVTEIIPIAKTHLNKIVVPFDNPRILTSVPKEQATQWTEGRVVFVATNQDAPFSFFIPLPDDPTKTLSLALTPTDRSTPVDVELRINGMPSGASAAVAQSGAAVPRKLKTDEAERWETGGTYEETLTRLVRGLALGQVPDGFGMVDLRGSNVAMPRCDLPNIRIEPRQEIDGARLIAFVGRAINTGNEAQEIDETRCAGPQVAAVAAWPQARLEPGEATELYIVVRRAEVPASSATRPSVLGGR